MESENQNSNHLKNKDMINRVVINSRPIQIRNKNNKRCSECGEPMVWIEGLLKEGSIDWTIGRYACESCNLFHKHKDSRATMKGRMLSKKYKDTLEFTWADITHLSTATQLGILREIQSNY